eukprot:TRINITY_DN25376_c0_g1_i2.p2 TRINITY_DN25376_c0_g1~~TRINITY_DN25376_c0_g1_i2.p2  ORF type:complete len:115 (-),score=30.38 TRINITY_DN25376_c0_g1_i2:18-362(-)
MGSVALCVLMVQSMSVAQASSIQVAGSSMSSVMEDIMTARTAIMTLATSRAERTVPESQDLSTSWFRSEKDCGMSPVSYTHLRAHETPEHLVCRLLLEKKKKKIQKNTNKHKIK